MSFSAVQIYDLSYIHLHTSSCARIVQLAKTKAITHLAYPTPFSVFSGHHLMSRNAKAWKLKRALLQNEEPCRAKTLQIKRQVPTRSYI